MTDAVRRRSPSEVLRRGYSDEEVGHLYDLARLFLDNGNERDAEVLLNGLVEVAPDFAPAWLALCYVRIVQREYDEAIACARQALRIDPEFIEAMLLLVTCLITTRDFSSAGTYLGEVRERIDAGAVASPNLVRLYRVQLARYQMRSV